MKKKYQEIELEVIFLTAKDVITESYEGVQKDPFDDWANKES